MFSSLWTTRCEGDADELARFVAWKWTLRRRVRMLRIMSLMALLLFVLLAPWSMESGQSRRDWLEAVRFPVDEAFPSLRETASPAVQGLIGGALTLAVAMALHRVYFTRMPLLHVMGELPLAALLSLLWPYALRNGIEGLFRTMAPWSGSWFWFFISTGIHDLMAILAFFLLRRIFVRRSLVEETRLAWTSRVLDVLRADMTGRACLDLDAHHVMLKRKRAGGGSTGKWVDPWFALQSPLADGNRLALRLTLRMSRKSKSKRKYTKIAERWTDTVDASLRIAPKRFPAPLSPEELVGKTSGKELTVQAASLEKGLLRIRAIGSPGSRHQNRYQRPADIGDTPAPPEVSDVLRLLAMAYGRLGALRLPPKVERRLAKGGSRGEKAAPGVNLGKGPKPLEGKSPA